MAKHIMPAFQLARHVRAMDDLLRKLESRQITRAILQAPPRHTKSTLASRVFPVWYHGRNPDHNIMVFTATDEMAKRAGRGAREIAREFMAPMFDVRLSGDFRSWQHWKIDGTPTDWGECMFASIGGGRTMGAGASCVIVDDYFRNVQDALSPARRDSQEEWLLSSAMSRLAPGAVVLLMATRWHREDLIGRAIRASEFTGEDWHVVDLPAISKAGDVLGRSEGEALWPAQWPLELLERRRAEYAGRGYPWMFEALYQQDPPEVLDVEWPAEYFAEHIWCDRTPAENEVRVVSLDSSKGQSDKSDYSAIVSATLTDDGIIWIDAEVDRWDLFAIAERTAQFLDEEKPDEFIVETNSFQELLSGDIQSACAARNVRVPIVGVNNTKDKRVRIRRLSRLLARGKLRFRRHSPGVALLVEQLRGFPEHKHDDGPDALEMAIRRIDQLVTDGLPEYSSAED